MRRLNEQMLESKKKLPSAVRAPGTGLTEVFGVGPVVAATVTGDVADVSRFAGRDQSPPATAPRRSRSPPGTARSTGCRCAGTGASTNDRGGEEH